MNSSSSGGSGGPRRVLQGTLAAPGVATGPAFLVREEVIQVRQTPLEHSQIPEELHRLESAVISVRQELLELGSIVRRDVGEAEARIFDVHLLLLDDQELVGWVRRSVERDALPAAWLLRRRGEDLRARMANLPDPYLRERAMDVDDVTERLVRFLIKGQRKQPLSLPRPSVVVGRDLSPAMLTQFRARDVLGIATEVGGSTSHLAILARALHLPAITGVEGLEQTVRTGDILALDAGIGQLVVRPNEKDLDRIEQRQISIHRLQRELASLRDLPCQTLDGRPIVLAANLELPMESENAMMAGAQGIGLYRTEFLYLAHRSLPGEEEQLGAYRFIIERMEGRPVTIRTLDSGGDKLVEDVQMEPDPNPFMGWRSIRVCLDRPALFRTQLRAILRASLHGSVRVMFPMIADIGEYLKARSLLDETARSLRAEGVPVPEGLPVGAMVEVPSAVMCAGHLARHCDFLSVGTNDLTQFALAVDRSHRRLTHLYDPMHPSVIGLIRKVVEDSAPHGTLVAVCGELAADPVGAAVLVGLGVDELSMSPLSLLEVKKMLRSISWEDARSVALEVSAASGSEEVRRILNSRLKRKVQGLGISSGILGIAVGGTSILRRRPISQAPVQ